MTEQPLPAKQPGYECHRSIASIGLERWTSLCGSADSFLHYHYLAALEASRCVGGTTAWLPQHLLLKADGNDRAALPLYLKSDSYGEFVFDWGWAQAAQRAGISYYPKLVTAIPYTPVTGPRMTHPEADTAERLIQAIEQTAETSNASSWHLLFSDKATTDALLSRCGADQLLERRDCHFVWYNRDYRDFDDFLDSLNSRKRKSIRRERRKVAEQGVTLQRYSGETLSSELIDSFFQFYRIPYHRRGRTPYLNLAFFQQLHAHLSDRMMLVVAQRDQQPVGAALFIHGENGLSGRWWGGLPSIDCLHFEACYYQGIEYAIEQGLPRFDPGIQGEHKLLRGFEPQITHSLHWIKDKRLAAAVAQWLVDERRQIDHYQQRARQHLPYKSR